MSWLKALEGKTWLAEPAGVIRRQRIDTPPKLRTFAGVQSTLEERIVKAKELAQLYRRSVIAQIMGVDQSTVSKWLGPKHFEKRPYGKRP